MSVAKGFMSSDATKVVGIGVTSGVGANVLGTNINQGINKHRQNKLNTYKRKLPNGKTVKVSKSPFHGVGRGQLARKKAQPVVIVNPQGGGGSNGLY